MQRDNLLISSGQNRKIIFNVPQGVTARLSMNWKNPDRTPIDLTGYTFVCQIRSGYADSGATVIRAISETINTTGDCLQINRADGQILVVLSAATTRAFKPEKNYYLEIKLTAPGGETLRRILATLEIEPEVAR